MPKIVIETDGKPSNTKVKIDGKSVSNLSEFYISGYFECYCGCTDADCCCKGVHFSYTTKKEDKKKEMKVRTRYTLDPVKASFSEENAGVDVKNPTSEDFENI